jgi:hypothetical protein
MALLYVMFRSLLPAVGQWRGFYDRPDIDGVLIILLFPMGCARAAEARSGATSAMWPARNRWTPLV